MQLSEKTPLSGPGTLKSRAGRKRGRNDAKSAGDKEIESLENEYRSKCKDLANTRLENLIVNLMVLVSAICHVFLSKT